MMVMMVLFRDDHDDNEALFISKGDFQNNCSYPRTFLCKENDFNSKLTAEIEQCYE